MNVDSGRHQRKRRHGRALAFLSITALALAASPAALAHECGGPGAPSVQQLSNTFSVGFRNSPLRYASWSD
jgi:ABC-type sugar transport system substrate-binding protein